MSKKREKPGEVRKNKKEENKRNFQEQSRQQLKKKKEAYKKSLIVNLPEQPKPTQEFSEADLEYIKIASTHPLDIAEFISQANHGKKFKTLQQRERFLELAEKYENYFLQCMKKTDVRGRDLEQFTIKNMLEDADSELSPVDRKILEQKLPKEIER